jgi:hypothetical protein
LTDNHETIEQIKTEAAIKETKITHFEITDFEGEDETEMYLESKNPHLMIVVYKPIYTGEMATRTVNDSIFAIDTLPVIGVKDSVTYAKKFVEVKAKQEEYYKITWGADFLKVFTEKVKPLVDAAAKDKVTASVVISGIDDEKAQTLAEASGIKLPYCR